MFGAGAIMGSLGLDVSPFSQGMLQANSIAALFPATVTNFLANPLLGVIGIAKDAASAIFSAFKSVGAAADNAGEAAEKAGVSVEFLTGIGAAFSDAGSSVEGLSDALKFLNKNASAAASGEKTAVASFEKLGLSAQFVKANLGDSETLLLAVADGIAGLGTTAQKTDVAMEVLGRGGADAIAALNKGSGGLISFADDVSKLGGVIDSDLADAGDAFGTLSTFVSAAMSGVEKAVARPILMALQDQFGGAKNFIFNVAATIQDVVGSAITGVMSFVTSNADIFGDIWGGVTGLLSGLLPLVGSLASLVGSILSPVLRIVAPLFHIVGAAVGVLADALAGLIGWIAKGVSALSGFLGLGSDVSSMSGTVAGAAAGSASSIAASSLKGSASLDAMTDSAHGLSGALKDIAGHSSIDLRVTGDVAAGVVGGASAASQVQSRGSGATTIGSMTVNVPPFDINAASSEVAAKILPPLRTEFGTQVKQMQAATRRDNVSKGL